MVARMCFELHRRELSELSTLMPRKIEEPAEVKDGRFCQVVGGTHSGKSGTVRDTKTSKTGHVTISVEPKNGERFKTLARNLVAAKVGDA